MVTQINFTINHRLRIKVFYKTLHDAHSLQQYVSLHFEIWLGSSFPCTTNCHGIGQKSDISHCFRLLKKELTKELWRNRG